MIDKGLVPDSNIRAMRSGMLVYDNKPCGCCGVSGNITKEHPHNNCLVKVRVLVPNIETPFLISACAECDGLVND